MTLPVPRTEIDGCRAWKLSSWAEERDAWHHRAALGQRAPACHRWRLSSAVREHAVFGLRVLAGANLVGRNSCFVRAGPVDDEEPTGMVYRSFEGIPSSLSRRFSAGQRMAKEGGCCGEDHRVVVGRQGRGSPRHRNGPGCIVSFADSLGHPWKWKPQRFMPRKRWVVRVEM